MQYGDTPLSDAAGNGHSETVQELVQIDGIDVNKQNKVIIEHAQICMSVLFCFVSHYAYIKPINNISHIIQTFLNIECKNIFSLNLKFTCFTAHCTVESKGWPALQKVE